MARRGWPGSSSSPAPPQKAQVLDVGCGTGEVTARMAELFPEASFLGIDIDEAHLKLARARCAHLGDRVRFQAGDAYALPGVGYDLVVCRHVLQAISDAPRAVREMVRVLSPGGRLHLVNEDYGMLFAHPTRHDPDVFWREGALVYGAAVGSDLKIG